MITLGLDPGLQTTNPAGWAVVDFDRPLEQAILAAGILPPRRGLRWEDQIAEQVAAIPALCSEYLVSYIACEDAFYGTNAQTFRQPGRPGEGQEDHPRRGDRACGGLSA
jgi:Holliday junction resolvasome RuvABC endonuclease subunit